MICTILWRVGESSSSCWYIPFFFWAFYHGQSINFAAKRKVFVILLQILVFMLFILGNAYQGLITSFMTVQREPYKMKSFDEVLQSDYKILVGNNFHKRMKSNYLYNIANTQNRVKIDDDDLSQNDRNNLRYETHAQVYPCEIANFFTSSGAVLGFYVINENFMPYFVQLQMAYLSKFLKQWQLIMDWSFEGGLTQAWDKFMAPIKTFQQQELRDDILRLGDISVIFYVLIFGCIFGFISLFCEIFWHDCFEPYLRRRKEMKKIKFERKLRRRKMRVRKIKVHPCEVSEEALNEVKNELERLHEPEALEQEED